MKYVIMVSNHGMWGYTTYCKRDGKPEAYDTEEEAKAVANRYNKGYNPFNRYYVSEGGKVFDE